jgi:hypothetical protein
MGVTFPPAGPTTLTQVLKAYVYKQYEDDQNIQAFNASFNTIAQQYMTFLVGLNLPVYTQLTGSLLDWIAQGLYGIARPSLQFGGVTGVGPLNTYGPNTAGIGLNVFLTTGSITNFNVNDDIFKRIITWNFFKGDGFYYSIPWLKRRVMRFLTCPNGTATNIDNTYPVSVKYGSGNTVLITISVTPGDASSLLVADIFQAAVASGVLQLPFQYSFTVSVVNVGSGLANNGGVLQVTNATGWPTAASGLAAGSLWDAGGAAFVIPGVTPNPLAPRVIFASITSAALLALGGGNLPTVDPVNNGQLWNNAGIVSVSLG